MGIAWWAYNKRLAVKVCLSIGFKKNPLYFWATNELGSLQRFSKSLTTLSKFPSLDCLLVTTSQPQQRWRYTSTVDNFPTDKEIFKRRTGPLSLVQFDEIRN